MSAKRKEPEERALEDEGKANSKKEKHEAGDESSGGGKQGVQKGTLSPEQEGMKNFFSSTISTVMGYGQCAQALSTVSGLAAQRDYISSMSKSPHGKQTFQMAKFVFWKTFTVDDSTGQLKFGPRLSESALKFILESPIVTILKEIFGPADPSVDLSQNLEYVAETIKLTDEGNRGAILIVFFLLLNALWGPSVQEVALDAYDCLKLCGDDVPDECSLPEMLTYSSVKSAVSLSFHDDKIPLGYMESSLRETLFEQSNEVGMYSAGGLDVFLDETEMNSIYHLASAFADLNNTTEVVEEDALSLKSILLNLNN